MNKLATLLLLPILVPVAGADTQRSHGAHEHGVATLNVVIEQSDLVIELLTPGANVVGFEHLPSTDSQRQAVSQAVATLSRGLEVFAPSEAAQCHLESIDVDTPLASATEANGSTHDHDDDHSHDDRNAVEDNQSHDDEHAHEDDHSHDDEHAHEDDHSHDHDHSSTHSDFEATWSFHCDLPENLTGIGVNLFALFEGFEMINVNFVGPSGQTQLQLHAASSVIEW